MAKLTQDQKEEIKTQMAGKTGAQAKQTAGELAKQFNCSISRIYAYSEDVRPKRKPRTDKGQLKAATENDFRALQWYTVNKDFSAPHLADIYAANHDGECLSEATYNRFLLRENSSRRQLKRDGKPYISWQADHPNQLHQLDSTVAQQFYLNDDGSIGFESHVKRYKNKPGNKKPRLHLIALVDDNTRVAWARFTLGNHTYAWLDFLFHAWNIKEDNIGHPFHGLPKVLYTDNDSVVKSKKFQRAMRLLGVRIQTHEVENPRAKGKVENMIKYLQEFEKIRKLNGWSSLEQANASLEDYLFRVNGRVHTATKNIPYGAWQKIKTEHLRAAPNTELFNYFHMDSDKRFINKDMTISLNGVIWQLPHKEPYLGAMYKGEKVELYWHPNITDKLYVVIDDKEHEIEYHGKQMRGVGRHEEVPKPDALIKREEIEAAPDPGLKQEMIYSKLYRKNYMPKQAEEFDDEAINEEFKTDGIHRDRQWFAEQLLKQYIAEPPLNAAHNDFINQIFGQEKTKPESELRTIIERLVNEEIHITKKQANA